MYPAIRLTQDVSLPTYMLVISLVYCLALVWVVKRAERLERDRTIALDIALIIMIGGFLGARLFHVVYEMPDYYLANPGDIFRVWQGGFVFYGGALTAFFASVVWLNRKGENWLAWADFYAPIGAFGYASGRFACLLNGCCFGDHCELPWSIAGRHPTPLYASLWELPTLALLLFLEARQQRSPKKWISRPGSLFFVWIFLHGLGRLIMEHWRVDDRGPMPLGISVSTWISLGLLLSSMVFFMWPRPNKSS